IKCGNRSVSSKSGSADALEALNIPLDLDVNRAVRQFEESGFTFLYAPAYHAAVAHVMPVRRAIKVPTIFNSLGPILSPARPGFQVRCVAKPKMGRTIAEGVKERGRGRAIVMHGPGTEEIALHAPTQGSELRDGDIPEYTVTPEYFAVSTHQLS